MEDNEIKIKLDQCIDGALYSIDARNFSIGVFNKEAQGFVGVRTKFGHRFLDVEFLWDSDGTVKNADFICMSPVEDSSEGYWLNGEYFNNQELLIWLEEKSKETKDE